MTDLFLSDVSVSLEGLTRRTVNEPSSFTSVDTV